MPATTVRLAPNLPVHIDVAFADLVGGKFGAQLRLKGKVNGVDSYIYVDHVEAMNSLLAMRAIPAIPTYDPDNLPEKGLTVSLAKKSLVVTKHQAAGEKYGTVTITTNGTPPAQTLPAPASAPAPSAATAPAGNALPAQPKLTAIWLDCLDFVLEHAVPRLMKADVGTTPEAIVAAAATLYISRTKQLGIT